MLICKRKLHFLISKTAGEMIVNNPDCLKSSINGRWTYKTKSSLFQIFGDCIRKFWFGLIIYHRLKFIINNFPIRKSPNIGIKRPKFWLNFQKCLSIRNGWDDLISVTNDSLILHEFFDFCFVKLYDLLGIKICKCGTVVFATL